MVDAVRLGGSVEAEPVTCMGVCVCAHGGTWVGTLPLRRGSAALGGARRVERSGVYYLPYQARRRSGIVSTWCKPPRTTRRGFSMSRPETRHDFDPYDGEPGKAWDDFDERLLNFTSGKTDDRGYSIADTLLEQDEGAANGPAFPVGVPAELRKAHAASRRRQKDAFSILLRHQTHPDHVKHLSANHFQDGVNAYKYLKASSQTAVNAIRLRELRRLWDDLDRTSTFPNPHTVNTTRRHEDPPGRSA